STRLSSFPPALSGNIAIYNSAAAHYNSRASQVVKSIVRAKRMNNSRPGTLVDLLKGAAGARLNEEVIRFKQDKQWTGLSGRSLLDRVRHVALGLYDLGIRKGDRVAILAESGPLWSISDYAILSNGAVNVPIYPTQPPHQVEYIL